MVKLEHGTTKQVLFHLANILSFGKYTHREKAGSDMEAHLDVARRLTYHTRFLRQVAKSSPQVDVAWNVGEVQRSLRFIAEHASDANSQSAIVAAKIFVRTGDMETRRACLDTLSRMNNPKARTELFRLSQQRDLDQAGKDLLLTYSKTPAHANEPLTVSGEKSTGTRVDQ